MKRPLVPVALCYAAGLLLAEFFQPSLAVLFLLSFTLLFTALAWSRKRMVLLWPLLVLVGWTNLTSRTAVLSPQDLRVVLGTNAAFVTVRGTLAETPSQRVFERDEQELWRSLAQVEVTALKDGTNWSPVVGRVMTSTTGQLPAEFFSGQPVEITGILTPPATPIAEGLFDYRAYLARQGIHFQLKVVSTNAWQLAPGAKTNLSLADRFLAWAQVTLARGLPVEAKDQPLRLLWAMTLGWRPALTNEVNEPFMRSGTMHIFAISGLHIALIAGILVSLLRVLRVSRAWCGLVVIPLIWFYTAATGWQPSAIRSTVMMTIIIGGWSLRRPTDLVNSLAAAAFIILVWDPQQLFQASFQLSFFVVLSIALFMPPLEKVRDRLLQHDPLLPPSLIPRWKRWLGTPLRWLGTALATSLAAWLGSLPLTAYYFHLFSPVTLLANLIIVPVSSAALACNLGSLICGDWLPWATELFNHSGWFWMLCMTRASEWATKIPGAFFYVPAPGVWDFVVYYALLIGTLSGWLFAKSRRAWSVAGMVVLAAVYFWRWQNARSEFQITVLPLNGAHGVFVDGAGRRNDWLIDCGNTNSVEFVMKPFLRAQGVNRLPRLLLTHGDLRHVGGAEVVEQLFGADEIEVFTSSLRFRSSTYRRIVEDLDGTPNRHRVIKRGDAVGVWQVLHPNPEDKFAQADDNALVLLGTFHGTRVLLLSDLGRPGQEALMEREPDLRADIVVAGLPEQGEPLCEALLERIQPRVVIVADSEFPATKRASPRLRERLEQHAVRLIYTRFSGSVTLTCGKAGWQLSAMDGMRIKSETVKLQIPSTRPLAPEER
jgi:DNA internalization-related competence protein ComEC/Rec2